jgi:soluble lytic murein transglycosylase
VSLSRYSLALLCLLGNHPSGPPARRAHEAAVIPSLNEWLIRRAALGTPDSLARRLLYQKIHSPIVRARLLETEAQARELTGDLLGAALRYDSLGKGVEATRLRLAASKTPAQRIALRDTLVAIAARRAGTSDVAAALDLLATIRERPTPAQAMILARAASQSRLAGRAVALYARAFAARLGTPADRLGYGIALNQTGRYREALNALRPIPAGSGAADEADYQRAIALARLDQRDRALAILNRLAKGSDSLVAPRALFTAGDLYWKARDGATARTNWLALASRYPRDDNASRAAFLAGMAEWESGHLLEAAEAWERAHQSFAGMEGLASGYWAGRAFDQAGQRRRAEGLWQSVIARDSASYYAVASFRRLGLEPWHPVPADDRFQSFAELDSTASRIEMLRSLSMTQEIQWEKDWLLADSRRQPERLLAAADLLRNQGQPAAAVTLARRALAAGARPDARTYRLIYPLLHEDELKAQALAAGVDQSVIAALIRQESIWEPEAKSKAGAIGLMQVMPATGKEIARALKVSRWNAEALLDPATNIRFGTYHLAGILRRFEGDLSRALAAYNAGASRVTTWNGPDDVRDPELFIERITFQETRDYVRIIERNLTLYRALYGS